MIYEIVQFQKIDGIRIDPLVSDHLQFHSVHVKNFVVDIVTVIESSIPIELHYVQDTLTPLNILDLRVHLEDLSKRINQVPLKTMTTTLTAIRSEKTNLKLTCIPLK